MQSLDRKFLQRLALALWISVVVIVCVRAYGWPHHSVLPIYLQAARNWQAGQDMYAVQPGAFDLYRYSPTVAVLLAPLSHLPAGLAGALWRLINLAAFCGGFAWWCRAVLPGGAALTGRQLAVMWLLLLPLSLESLLNGQANVLVIGLILAALAAVASGRWNLAAVCAALPVLLKVYPLAVGLLLMAIYPRKFGPRFLVALALGLALPFLCQQVNYVAAEYQTWLELLIHDNRSAFAPNDAPQDLALLFRIAKVPLDSASYLALRLALAAAVAGSCLAACLRSWPQRELLTLLGGQACCWMILCGPNSEPHTYVLLAPVLAWAVVEAWQPGCGLMSRARVLVVLTVLLLPFAARMLSGGKNNLAGVMALGALLLWMHWVVSRRWARRFGEVGDTAMRWPAPPRADTFRAAVAFVSPGSRAQRAHPEL